MLSGSPIPVLTSGIRIALRVRGSGDSALAPISASVYPEVVGPYLCKDFWATLRALELYLEVANFWSSLPMIFGKCRSYMANAEPMRMKAENQDTAHRPFVRVRNGAQREKGDCGLLEASFSGTSSSSSLPASLLFPSLALIFSLWRPTLKW